ncbi:MAG: hypothetical protein OEL84_07230 [Nitrosopumilus sp.]|nr:hypothetical protein [Nitrosopumilus sp.]MDH3341061.1 hypothetical protein [Nitrosopumilus sp.]
MRGISKEIIWSHQMSHTSYTSAMILIDIPYPASIELHLLFAKGARYDHGRVFAN